MEARSIRPDKATEGKYIVVGGQDSPIPAEPSRIYGHRVPTRTHNLYEPGGKLRAGIPARIFQGKANAAARLLAVGGARAAVCSFVQATTDFPKEIFPFPTFAIFLPPCWAWPESVRLLPDRHSRTFAEIPQLNFLPVAFPLFVKTILENLAPSPANPHLMLVRVTFLHVCIW